MEYKHYVVIIRMTEKRIMRVDELTTMNDIKSAKDMKTKDKNLKYIDLGLENFSVTISA